ncbi:MAG: hypothetical protein AAGI28_03485 [Pseudomonadota bacterium]
MLNSLNPTLGPDESMEAIVPNVPIVPALLDDNSVLEVDWDEIDAFGLMAEIGPFDPAVLDEFSVAHGE